MNSTKRIISLEISASGLAILLAIFATTTAPEAQGAYPGASQIRPGSIEVVVADFATPPLSSRALIDRAGLIETGDDLIEWVEESASKGLGLAQKQRQP